MKLRLTVLSLAGLTAFAALAQDPAPPAPPPPAPAPGADLLPPAQGVPAETPDKFKSEKERQSYAVGWLFASREKNNATAGGNPQPNPDEVSAGLKDVLANGKSLDYALGAMLAMQIRRAEVDVDTESLLSAVHDAMTGQQPQLAPQQQQMVIQRVQNEVKGRLETRQKAEKEKALKAATDFLTENAKAEGVKTTPSGLQYKIEKEGDGKSAAEGDIATLNYKATTLEGTEFEKSQPDVPSRKPVRMMPKGVQEGLAIIKSGTKAKFWLPPALGYGENGRPPQIKGNSVLIYDIEMLATEPLPKPPPNAGANPNAPGKAPVTAVTPPISVEIPPKSGETPKPAPPAPPPAPEKK